MSKTVEETIEQFEKNNAEIEKLLEVQKELARELKDRPKEDWDWISVSTACKIWDICPATMYKRINTGKLKTRKFDNKIYVSQQEVKAIAD